MVRQLVALVIALTTIMLAAPLQPASAQTSPGTGAIEVHLAECPAGYDGVAWEADCHDNGITGASISIAGPVADSKTTVDGGGPGVVQFGEIPAGTYTITANLPDTGQGWATYCSPAGDDTERAISPENSPTGAVALNAGETLICDIFSIPPAPSNPAPPAAPALATLALDPLTCPVGTDPDSDPAALATACGDRAEDVTFTLTSGGATVGSANSSADPSQPVTFADLAAGDYSIVSSVPLEFAAERLVCTADGGDPYEKPFSETGVAAFVNVDGEALACDWYIVPYDLQGDPGDAAASSLTVHLAACPPAYDGSAFYADCHDNGIADQEFFLTGPGVETSGITTIPQEPGPGVETFTDLPAGDYQLAGGPPGDFGTVRLVCTDRTDDSAVDATVSTTQATLAIGAGQEIVCDWYYIPDNAQGETPTPVPPTSTPAPDPRAEIIVTLLACDAGETMAGASYADFTAACDTPRDGVSFKLGDPGAPPISAETGVSGPGAVRFYDLLPADYTLTPTLPSGLSSAAVFCRIDGGERYQKTLTSGATTFVNVAGESIACEWFATQPAPSPSGPSGAITVREYLCEEDASEIEDWERECAAGSSGVRFTVASTDGTLTRSSATDASGVAAFTGLPDGFYTLRQESGAWCKAKAERVDSSSRVIVENGENTTVFIYQCAQVTDLPSTGTGSTIQPMAPAAWWAVATPLELAGIAAGGIGIALLGAWALTRRRPA